jgi:tripartite-type tricarboxylate transporter receptor subunit TctC
MAVIMDRRALIAGAAAASLVPQMAAAQEYPSRPIRLIVAFAAGGPTDVLARLLADGLGRKLGQTVVVENHGGAGGNIGYGMAASAAPDGYTLAFADPSITVNASLYKNLPFDVEHDFVSISAAFRGPTVVVVPGKSEIKTLADLIKVAKANPGKLNYGSAGNGTPPHLNAEVFKASQGLDILHVPYRGAAPAITDLIAARVDLMFLNIGSAKPQIDSGELRGLAVSGNERAPALPNVPTFKEAGLPLPALDPGTWWGVMAPAKLPAALQTRLNAAMRETLEDPDLRKRVAAMSVDVIPGTTKEFAVLVSEERRKWADVVTRANIKVE